MTPMTARQKEVAARKLCELNGWDPDETEENGHGEPVPRWFSVVVFTIEPEERKQLSAARVQQAIAAGRESGA